MRHYDQLQLVVSLMNGHKAMWYKVLHNCMMCWDITIRFHWLNFESGLKLRRSLWLCRVWQFHKLSGSKRISNVQKLLFSMVFTEWKRAKHLSPFGLRILDWSEQLDWTLIWSEFDCTNIDFLNFMIYSKRVGGLSALCGVLLDRQQY